MEDTQIIDLYWQRDERAIGETDTKYGSFCHKLAMNILHSFQDSEECVSDAYGRCEPLLGVGRPVAADGQVAQYRPQVGPEAPGALGRQHPAQLPGQRGVRQRRLRPLLGHHAAPAPREPPGLLGGGSENDEDRRQIGHLHPDPRHGEAEHPAGGAAVQGHERPEKRGARKTPRSSTCTGSATSGPSGRRIPNTAASATNWP